MPGILLNEQLKGKHIKVVYRDISGSASIAQGTFIGLASCFLGVQVSPDTEFWLHTDVIMRIEARVFKPTS
jgi:hypothetical protein